MRGVLIAASAICLVGLVAVAVRPASALEVGGSAKVGDREVSAGTKVDRDGASVGAKVGDTEVSGSAKIDGGGLSGGGGVSSGGRSAKAEVGGNTGGSGSGSSAGSGGGAGAGSGGGSAASGGAAGGAEANSGSRNGNSGKASRVAARAGAKAVAISLPARLRPRCGRAVAGCNRANDNRGAGVNAKAGGLTSSSVLAMAPLPFVPGTPLEVVSICRQGIIQGARAYGPVRVDAASAGRVAQTRGGYIAPLRVRIVYQNQGGYEVRDASVRCQVDGNGTVAGIQAA